MTPCPQINVDMDHTTTHKQKWLFFLKASTDPKTINIDIGGTGVMCLKVKTYDEVAVSFEEPGIAHLVFVFFHLHNLCPLHNNKSTAHPHLEA